MIYRAIGVMSGSSLDGLDIAFAEFQENAGKWNYDLKIADCYPYPADWLDRLQTASSLSGMDYQLLHCDFGHYIGRQVNKFIEENNLQYQAALIASHGHTTFHMPPRMTGQIGEGASIAAETQLPVITDLRALDLAFGGQGAPIVPIGEKLLLGEHVFFLNIGGISNISCNNNRGNDEEYLAFDVCPANRVLNMIAKQAGKEYDEGGKMAASGNTDNGLLERLNALDYYHKEYPKSLANDFGTDIVFPLVQESGISIQDALRTYTEHIAIQVKIAARNLLQSVNNVLHQAAPSRNFSEARPVGQEFSMLVTGGGAFNTFLIERLKNQLAEQNIKVVVPGENLVKFKEALIMAFIGVLRWREEYNVLSSVTGATRSSIGGAVWLGQEA